MNLNSFESNIIPKLNYRDLEIFLVPILIFTLYLLAYRPGVLTVASYSQLHQIAIGKYTTAYPMFHTFLVMLFIKFFNSTFLMGAFQIIIFSVMWMAICKYHRNDSSKSNNEFVLQFIVTLIISLIPINAIYSITLSSNVLFSYSMMFLCFLIKILIDRDGQLDTKMAILLAATLAVMCGLNNYGIIVALISLTAIAYYLYRKNTPQNKFVTLVGLTIIGILLISSFSLIYEVKGSNYDTYTSLVNIPSNDAFEEGVNLESAKNQFFSSTNYEPKESYENVVSEDVGNIRYNIIDSFVNLFRGGSILDCLFNNPIWYMILSVLVLGFIYIKVEKEELILMFFPIISNTLIMYATGINNLYSNILFFYLVVIILICLLFNSDLRPHEIATLSTDAHSQTRLHKPQQSYMPAEPQYNPPKENYEEDYSYIEREIENLTLDDINEMLGKSPSQDSNLERKQDNIPNNKPDLLDEILKEIEMEKK